MYYRKWLTPDLWPALPAWSYRMVKNNADVLRRREDGYHEVKMIMQTIGLYDTLTFIKKAEPGIVLKIDREGLDAGKDNLIYTIRGCLSMYNKHRRADL